MPSCLGIYIESNLIKYAKVTKERENIKLDAYGVKFYDEIESSIEQIINETFSYNIPVSVNTRDEKYNYFEMFNMLAEKDMEKAIATEYELLCDDKGYSKDSSETRYILITNQEDREKIKAMHISCNKSELNKINQTFQKYKLKSLSPLPVAIINNIEIGVKENAMILNLEETATITTIINGQINKVKILDNGMAEVFEKINKKENSYAKVYDILKNTTIYTSDSKDLSDDNNNYLQDIMPTLYQIVNVVKDEVLQNINNIDKLFITGTGAVINNVDLYFQEFLPNTKCSILKPYFTKNTAINMSSIRDYIEVNSAIALGLQGLGDGTKTVNFKSSSFFEKLKELSTMEIGSGKSKSQSKSSKGNSPKFNFKLDFNDKIGKLEKGMLRYAGGVAMIIIAYIVGVSIISGMINAQKEEADELIKDTNEQIAKIDEDIQKIKNKTQQYSTLIRKLDEINQKIADKNSVKNAIPNLLANIMTYVPKDVQVTEIKNTTEKHVVIYVQAKQYDPIGYFIGAINNNGILVNAKTNSGIKQNGTIRITIEGDMP